MKIFISPAKSLDLISKPPAVQESQPHFLSEANSLNRILKNKTVNNLIDLMNLSEKLSQLNWERNQNFITGDSRPAIFTFNGDVYSGLDPYSFSNKKLDTLQKNLRIISGLYGILRPFDLIKPYRLEMGTSLRIGKNNNLYEFWKKKITNHIIEEINHNEVIVDLASKEYSLAINFKSIKNSVISPVFKDFKNGKHKIISFYAKRARGLMAKWIIENKIKDFEKLSKFNLDGYYFSESESSATEPVFLRD